jgi:hypothetical protein
MLRYTYVGNVNQNVKMAYCLLLLKWQKEQCTLVTANDVIVIDVFIIV